MELSVTPHANQASTESDPLAGKLASQATEMTVPIVQSQQLMVAVAAISSGTEMSARETTLRLAASSTALSGTLNAEPTSTPSAAASAHQIARQVKLTSGPHAQSSPMAAELAAH